MLNKKQFNILVLPKWYPSKVDLQLGVFLKKHTLAISEFHKTNVLYVVSDENLEATFLIKNQKKGNYNETISYFKNVKFKIELFKRFTNLILYTIAFFRAYNRHIKPLPKPDFIHVHIFGRTSIFAYFLKLFKSIPYIVSEQSSLFITDKFSNRNFLYRKMIRFTARNANLLTAVSTVLRDRMIKYKMDNTYFVVPNVVEVSENTFFKEQKNKTLILSVADLFDKVKNISDVIKAVKYAAEKGYEFEYHVIGGGYDRDELVALAEGYNLLDKVIFFHGRQPNPFVLDFMHKIDFLITNSNYETFSVVTAEALANGKPVISTRCGGPESFVDEKSGILIDVGNLEQLKTALINMLENHSFYNSKEIIDSVKTRFSFEAIGEQFNAVYSELFKKYA